MRVSRRSPGAIWNAPTNPSDTNHDLGHSEYPDRACAGLFFRAASGIDRRPRMAPRGSRRGHHHAGPVVAPSRCDEVVLDHNHRAGRTFARVRNTAMDDSHRTPHQLLVRILQWNSGRGPVSLGSLVQTACRPNEIRIASRAIVRATTMSF